MCVQSASLECFKPPWIWTITQHCDPALHVLRAQGELILLRWDEGVFKTKACNCFTCIKQPQNHSVAFTLLRRITCFGAERVGETVLFPLTPSSRSASKSSFLKPTCNCCVLQLKVSSKDTWNVLKSLSDERWTTDRRRFSGPGAATSTRNQSQVSGYRNRAQQPLRFEEDRIPERACLHQDKIWHCYEVPSYVHS